MQDGHRGHLPTGTLWDSLRNPRVCISSGKTFMLADAKHVDLGHFTKAVTFIWDQCFYSEAARDLAPPTSK